MTPKSLPHFSGHPDTPVERAHWAMLVQNVRQSSCQQVCAIQKERERALATCATAISLPFIEMTSVVVVMHSMQERERETMKPMGNEAVSGLPTFPLSLSLMFSFRDIT